MAKGKSIFRAQALEKLSSPEQLDQLLQVVNRKSWLPLAALAILLVLAITWSVVGQIPITVEGQGLLVYPRRVVSLQAPAGGQIVDLQVGVGDFIEKGQVLGVLNQPELQQLLEQERIRLSELQARGSKVLLLHRRRMELERQAILKKRELLEQRIAQGLRLAREHKARNDAYLARQRENLEQRNVILAGLGQSLETLYQGYNELKRKRLITDEMVIDAQRTSLDNQVRIAELGLLTQELELSEINAEDAFAQQMNRVADWRFELEDLAIEEAQLEQTLLEATSDSELQEHELRRNIARYESELRDKSRVVSEYPGRILEITAAVGQIVTAGHRLGALEVEDPKGELFAVAYLNVGDGKKVESGMATRVSPDTVQRERFGSMVGEVVSVSRFPVTTDAVVNVVGSAEIAKALVQGGPRIEVFSRLEPDSTTPTRYRWTSGDGPKTRVSAGTTLTLRTIVRYRRPITYAIPLLREWGRGA